MISVRNAAFMSVVSILVIIIFVIAINTFASYGKVFDRKELCQSKGGVMTSNSKCVQEIQLHDV